MAKIRWKSQDEINREKAEYEARAKLPTDRERIEALEEALLEVILEDDKIPSNSN
ncbi:hypothetical protein [Amphibacillus sediminis]|uniref:hypothetical protein n=1 Tax=Amphibacillus sediminis TaxID=360185 RepID=UPI0012ECEFDA|nr:hypothetical protein [Amphibacillus sediminis]